MTPRRREPARAGVTLMEMLIVVALIGLLAAVMFPSIASGVDTLRLRQATDSIVSFLNSGLNRAARLQAAVEIGVLVPENELLMHSSESNFERRLLMPDGVRILNVLPEVPVDPTKPRTFLLYPGAAPPRIGITLVNRRGNRRIVTVDPITGVPVIQDVPEAR